MNIFLQTQPDTFIMHTVTGEGLGTGADTEPSLGTEAEKKRANKSTHV